MTKKKVELTTTRQIETRVKRQVILEDGKVVEDSGPIVTTNTTEDTEKQEHSQTEVSPGVLPVRDGSPLTSRLSGTHCKIAGVSRDNGETYFFPFVYLQHRTTGDDPPGEEWIAAPGRAGIVKEVKERTVKSREETEERLETEDVQHLGDISDEVISPF